MLSANVIKEFIVNPDVYLSSAAVRYFADSLDEDERILNLVLDRCSSISEEEQNLLITEATNLKLNSESMNKIATRLPNISQKLRLTYEKLLLNADASLVKALNLDKQISTPEIRIALNQKLQISTNSTGNLLEELLNFSLKNDTKYINEFNHRYGNLIVDELAKRENLDENEIIKALTTLELDEYGYYECYLLTLAGKRRLKALTPLFVRGLGKNDLVSEESMYALLRLGTSDIPQIIIEKFPRENEDFKIYAAGVLENIKILESEKAALKLLKEESNVTIKTLLAGALCQLFSSEAIPHIKDFIEDGYDSSMLNLEEYAYTNCVFNGLDMPEMKLWKESFDEERGFYLSPSKLNLPATSESKVGRNDPCPCGSGKKYKKCCGKD